MAEKASPKQLLIIGGGYAGLKLAQKLGRQQLPEVQIKLLSNKSFFEYYPTLYRVAVGFTSRQVCIPLAEILANTGVEIVQDMVKSIDLKTKKVHGGEQTYDYDYLVIAVGAETSYFGIPGLPELSYGFKSTAQALKLREHVQEMAKTPETSHFVVVGAGPTGTEVASELVQFAREAAQQGGGDPASVRVQILEAAPRVLPTMPEDVSAKVDARLRQLGVEVSVNAMVTKQEGDDLELKDAKIHTQTVIWTAGVKTNALIATIQGLELDKRGRVVVDEYLQAKGFTDIFVAGDAASTQFGGTAQTADGDGAYLATVIGQKIAGEKSLAKYAPHKPIYAVPVGPDWAVVLWGETRIYGWFGQILRRLADFRYFLSILPFGRALALVSAHDQKGEEFSGL